MSRGSRISFLALPFLLLCYLKSQAADGIPSDVCMEVRGQAAAVCINAAACRSFRSGLLSGGWNATAIDACIGKSAPSPSAGYGASMNETSRNSGMPAMPSMPSQSSGGASGHPTGALMSTQPNVPSPLYPGAGCAPDLRYVSAYFWEQPQPEVNQQLAQPVENMIQQGGGVDRSIVLIRIQIDEANKSFKGSLACEAQSRASGISENNALHDTDNNIHGSCASAARLEHDVVVISKAALQALECRRAQGGQ